MINSTQRDQRRRLLVFKFQRKRVQQKTLLQNSKLSLRSRRKELFLKNKKNPFHEAKGKRSPRSVALVLQNNTIESLSHTVYGVLQIKHQEILDLINSIEHNSIADERRQRLVGWHNVRSGSMNLTSSMNKVNSTSTNNCLESTFQESYTSPKIVRNSSKTRIRNRCVLTSRSRGVLRFCKLSRICLRELAAQGALSGVSKASW